MVRACPEWYRAYFVGNGPSDEWYSDTTTRWFWADGTTWSREGVRAIDARYGRGFAWIPPESTYPWPVYAVPGRYFDDRPSPGAYVTDRESCGASRRSAPPCTPPDSCRRDGESCDETCERVGHWHVNHRGEDYWSCLCRHTRPPATTDQIFCSDCGAWRPSTADKTQIRGLRWADEEGIPFLPLSPGERGHLKRKLLQRKADRERNDG